MPTRGIERWLTQRLSARLGSRARDDAATASARTSSSRFPAALVAGDTGAGQRDRAGAGPVAAGATGLAADRGRRGRRSRRPGSSRWRATCVSGHQQRYARLAHVARLFDEYAVRRPELIEAWARGESGGVDERSAAGWQPELWRRLRERCRRAQPGRAARGRLRGARGRARAGRRCRRAWRCSGSRACR